MITKQKLSPQSQAALAAAAQPKRPSAQEDLNAELQAVLRRGAQLKKAAPAAPKPVVCAAPPQPFAVLRKTGRSLGGARPEYRKSVRLDALMQELDK